jgi:hypothetical protein
MEGLFWKRYAVSFETNLICNIIRESRRNHYKQIKEIYMSNCQRNKNKELTKRNIAYYKENYTRAIVVLLIYLYVSSVINPVTSLRLWSSSYVDCISNFDSSKIALDENLNVGLHRN